MKLRSALSAAFSLTLAIAAGAAQAQATVDGAFARATVGKQANGAAYLQLSAKGDDVLLSASAPVASKVEIHSMSMEGDVMKMRALEQLTLKGGQKLEMKPGSGVHIMLMGLKKPLPDGSSVPLKLIVEDAQKKQSTLDIKVPVKKTAPAKAADGHHQHGHDHGHHQH